MTMVSPLSLGLITALGADPRARLEQVKAWGLSHIQWPYAAQLDTPEGRKAILEAVQATGIAITTVFCAYEGENYADIATIRRTVGLLPPSTRAARAQKTGQISGCAQQLGVMRVALHLGFIPEDAKDGDYLELVALTAQIADDLAARGQVLALETGQETAQTLLRFLGDVARPNMRVNFDPANMILYGNDNPLDALPLLMPHIDEVHCKDGKWPTQAGQLGTETRFGEGDVDAPAWLQSLVQHHFRGPLTIEREIEGEQQGADILAAKTLIESVVGLDSQS